MGAAPRVDGGAKSYGDRSAETGRGLRTHPRHSRYCAVPDAGECSDRSQSAANGPTLVIILELRPFAGPWPFLLPRAFRAAAVSLDSAGGENTYVPSCHLES